MSALLLRAFLAVICLLYPLLAPAQSLRVAARVNDDAITDFDLNERIIFAIRSSGLQDTPEMHQRLAAQILQQMIDEKLQIQNAAALKINSSEAEINLRVGEIERAAAMQPGSFKGYLQSIGVPFDVASQQIEASLDWIKIVRKNIRPRVFVSESEVDDAAARMRSNVGKTESRVAEIFVPIDRPEQAEEAHRAAERIVEQIRRGAPFAALAQQFSRAATAQAGGDLGWILPGSLDPALEAAMDKLPLRQASEPLRTSAGWHILYVVDRRQFATARPDDMKLDLVQMTLALPVNASDQETNRVTAEAQKAMAAVHQCTDLHAQARSLKGATSGDLKDVRVADLRMNKDMYTELPKLKIGGTAGPFRVTEGLQVVSLCAKEGEGGIPTRDQIGNQLMIQKLEAAARRYMRELRRHATIEIPKP
jgi:peptidyl-prolyl cis-trans isomerase SurA